MASSSSYGSSYNAPSTSYGASYNTVIESYGGQFQRHDGGVTEVGDITQDEEVQLYSSTKERRKWDQLGDLFAILKTVEHLEAVRIQGVVSADEYTHACQDLIGRFKSLESALVREKLMGEGGAEAFAKEFGMDVPYAIDRLVTYGVPATVLHKSHDGRDASSAARQAAEVTQHFITVMDALKLEQKAVDEIHPLISDLVSRMNKCQRLPDDFIGVNKAKKWLATLNNMRASDELSDDQVRQLLHDLDIGYGAFFESLERPKKG
eukprot:514101_1